MEPTSIPVRMTPRRHIFLIDREYQWRYLSTWLIMTLAYVLLILLVMYVGLKITRETSANPDSITTVQLSKLLQYNAVFVILLTIFLGLITVLLSHRVAGPAYRLVLSMRRILGGDYNFKVKLRKKDYLQDVAAQMNDLIDDLRMREEKLKELDAEADRLRGMIASAGVSPEIHDSVERISLGLDSVLVKSPVPEIEPLAREGQGPLVHAPEA